MALNTCEMWSNGIKIASFFMPKITKNCRAVGGLALRLLQTPSVMGLSYISLLNTSPNLHFCSFFCLSPLRNFFCLSKILVVIKHAGHAFWSFYLQYLCPTKVPLSKISEDAITCDLWFGTPQSKTLATPMPLVVHALLQLVIFMTKQKSSKNFFEWIIIYR